MKPVSILVAEDEAPQREALVAQLRALWPDAKLVAACADGLAALEAFEREPVSVAFLDIRMPGLSGLELARRFSPRAHIVFVTAYDAYAVAAFEHGAVDYLLKPVQTARLVETLERLKVRLALQPRAMESLIAQLRRELQTKAHGAPLQWINASVGDCVKMYGIEEVLAFRAQDKYTSVLTQHDEAVIRTSLRELLSQLDPETFWQVHRSVVVRRAAIDSVRRDEAGKCWLRLKGRDELLPVSLAFQSRFRGM